MKLLLDANISRRMIPELVQHFGECVHANTIGLSVPLTDIQIWDYAQQHDYIIVTQDSDFLHFYETKGYPPKVVLLRTGNMTKNAMLSVILQSKQLIKDLHKGDYGLLEIVEKKKR
jgi:predicted nuclease of predicted toxin-antitoxin system